MMNDEEEWDTKDIRELLHSNDYSKAMDLRGVPIGDSCICGSDIFIALISFQKKEICFYFLDGECANCGSMVTLPFPGDELKEEEDCE